MADAYRGYELAEEPPGPPTRPTGSTGATGPSPKPGPAAPFPGREARPCPHCGYDLRGLTGDVTLPGQAATVTCPECGEDATPGEPAWVAKSGGGAGAGSGVGVPLRPHERATARAGARLAIAAVLLLSVGTLGSYAVDAAEWLALAAGLAAAGATGLLNTPASAGPGGDADGHDADGRWRAAVWWGLGGQFAVGLAWVSLRAMSSAGSPVDAMRELGWAWSAGLGWPACGLALARMGRRVGHGAAGLGAAGGLTAATAWSATAAVYFVDRAGGFAALGADWLAFVGYGLLGLLATLATFGAARDVLRERGVL